MIVFFFSILLSLFQETQPPKFEAQLIDPNISIGYGLAIGDVDGDQKPDILLADKKQFVWYRNGDWKRFVMVDNLTKSDNVCIAARDIDGDGKVEVAVGAQWTPSETLDTLKSGSVHYLIRPADPTKLWTPVKLHHEPTVHRMRWVKIKPDVYQLIVVPLHGRGNKMGDGEGVKVIAYDVPKDPTKKWKYTVIDKSMHVTHNFDVSPMGPADEAIVIGGKEGVKSFRFMEGKWTSLGYKVNDRSFGEVRSLSNGSIAGVVPMHGNELGIYTINSKKILTTDLNEGHALAVADLIDSKQEEIIVGWREPNKETKIGIKLFVSDPAPSETWKEYWIDNNTMACEDLQVADLDGDGKKDIVAAGRSTHNLKIYWNKN